MLKKKSYTVYILGKKFLTPERFGKKISTKSVKWPISDSPTNVQWSCQPFRGWGKKRIWHLSKCYPSTKWLASIHVVVFKTKVLHFKIENTPIKDTNGKRKFKRTLSFLFVGKRKLFAMKFCFEEFNLVFFTADRSAWLVLWTNQSSEVSEDTWGTFRTLWSKKSTFLKGNFCTYKGFMDVFYILTSALKKTHKICIWNWFFAMYSTDLTCVNAMI